MIWAESDHPMTGSMVREASTGDEDPFALIGFSVVLSRSLTPVVPAESGSDDLSVTRNTVPQLFSFDRWMSIGISPGRSDELTRAGVHRY